MSWIFSPFIEKKPPLNTCLTDGMKRETSDSSAGASCGMFTTFLFRGMSTVVSSSRHMHQTSKNRRLNFSALFCIGSNILVTLSKHWMHVAIWVFFRRICSDKFSVYPRKRIPYTKGHYIVQNQGAIEQTFCFLRHQGVVVWMLEQRTAFISVSNRVSWSIEFQTIFSELTSLLVFKIALCLALKWKKLTVSWITIIQCWISGILLESVKIKFKEWATDKLTEAFIRRVDFFSDMKMRAPDKCLHKFTTLSYPFLLYNFIRNQIFLFDLRFVDRCFHLGSLHEQQTWKTFSWSEKYHCSKIADQEPYFPTLICWLSHQRLYKRQFFRMFLPTRCKSLPFTQQYFFYDETMKFSIYLYCIAFLSIPEFHYKGHSHENYRPKQQCPYSRSLMLGSSSSVFF